MLEKFFPDVKVGKFTEVTVGILNDKGIRAVILDIDNTLVPYEIPEPTPEVTEWINTLRRADIKVAIVSNAAKERVDLFNRELQVFALHKAAKPGTKSFLKAIELMDVQPYQTAVVGDQIFTDIYGGRRLNMLTFLVQPISPKEIFPIRAKRLLEKIVLYFHMKAVSAKRVQIREKR